MPTATEQQEAPQQEQQEATPDLVSKVPTVKKSRKEDVCVSRSRRQALGGVVTSILLRPDGRYVVPDVPGQEEREFSQFAVALRFARTGEPPKEAQAQEPEATEEEPTTEAEGDEAQAEESQEEAA
jgi:hypothetical protein